MFTSKDVCNSMLHNIAHIKLTPLTEALLYHNGQYTLAFAELDDAKSSLLMTLLANLSIALEPVISDLLAVTPQGTPNPSDAYLTFFKDGQNRFWMSTLMKNITNGAPVYPPSAMDPSILPYSPNGGPVIIAVTKVGQISFDPRGSSEDLFTWCQNNPTVTASVAYSVKIPNPYVILCPFFFEAKPPDMYGDMPPSSVNGRPAPNCLQMKANTKHFKRPNRFQPAGYDLRQWRMWILLEMLSNLYSSATQGRATTAEEDANKCLRLSAQDALLNGPSYTLYAASKSPSSCDLCIYILVC